MADAWLEAEINWLWILQQERLSREKSTFSHWEIFTFNQQN